jgi:hypothetical protein
MKYSLLILVSTLFALNACDNTQSNNQTKLPKTETLLNNSKLDTSSIVPNGFTLLENNCFVCHSPDAKMEVRLAPPMEAVKRHYIDKETKEDEFTADLIKFINNPSEENTKMPGAVKKFGVMPKMSFSETELKAIANYNYNSELEKPYWFDKHYKEEKAKYSGKK